MPQHKSAAKRIRQNEKRRLRNRQHRSRMRTLIKKLSAEENKEQATHLFREVQAYLDRLATRGILKKNKAANYKRSLQKKINALD